jgi:hypothetical protein
MELSSAGLCRWIGARVGQIWRVWGLFSRRTKSNDFGITSPKMLLINSDLTAVSDNQKRHCSLTQRPGNSCQTRVVSVDIDLTKSFLQHLND